MTWIIPAAALAIIITLFIVNRRKGRRPGGYGGGYYPGRGRPDDREIERR